MSWTAVRWKWVSPRLGRAASPAAISSSRHFLGCRSPLGGRIKWTHRCNIQRCRRIFFLMNRTCLVLNSSWNVFGSLVRPVCLLTPWLSPACKSGHPSSLLTRSIAGGYLGYAYAPLTAQQLSAAGLQAAAGLPAAYAASAGPTSASPAAQQSPETRLQ